MTEQERNIIIQIADAGEKLSIECQKLDQKINLQQQMIDKLLEAMQQNSEQIQHNNEGIKIVMEVLKVNRLV